MDRAAMVRVGTVAAIFVYKGSDMDPNNDQLRAPIPKPIIGKRPTQAAGLTFGVALLQALPSRMSRLKDYMKLIRQIRDYNADASKAISNILRLANSGWTMRAVTLRGRSNPQAQAYLDQLIDPESGAMATEYGGGLDVLIDMAHLCLATQGAVAVEMELTAGPMVADVIPINPWMIDWRVDEITQKWVPGIIKAGSEFVTLHPLQFKYYPLDPEPGDPRGRSPFLAALDVVFFQMEVLRDLKAAAHFAGYPRMDVSVAWDAVLQEIKDTRPDLLQPGRQDDLKTWLDSRLGGIATTIQDLNPDDAFIHYDPVTANFIVPSGRSISTAELISALDAQIVSGLKQLPILLGRNEGSTTTHASVQWQVYVKDLVAFQRITTKMVTWFLELALRVGGFQGFVQFEFEPIRTTDRVQEASAEKTETETKLLQVAAGWIDHREAANQIVGHDPVSEPMAPPTPPPAEDQEDGDQDQEDEDQEDQANLIPGHTIRSMMEELDGLPYWQRQYYATQEASLWDLYQGLARSKWRQMDQTLQETPEEDLEPDQTNGQARRVSMETGTNGRPK